VSYFVAIAGLLILILVHEAGHFVAAKAVGMRAIRFSIGFPPLIARRQIGDTEYALGAIPLGGYVKIPGMNRPEAGDLWEIGDLLDRSESLPQADASAIGGIMIPQMEKRGYAKDYSVNVTVNAAIIACSGGRGAGLYSCKIRRAYPTGSPSRAGSYCTCSERSINPNPSCRICPFAARNVLARFIFRNSSSGIASPVS